MEEKPGFRISGTPIPGVAKYTAYGLEACPDEDVWRGRIHQALFEAGIIGTATPERSPLAGITYMRAASAGAEDKIAFMLKVASGWKRAVDAAFKPHKSTRFHEQLKFQIPVSFFEKQR